MEYKADKSEAVKTKIIAMLSRKSAFSAFKKWIIIDKANYFSEFSKYIDD